MLLEVGGDEAFAFSTGEEHIPFPLSSSHPHSLSKTPPLRQIETQIEMRIKTHPSNNPFYDIPERPAGSDESSSRERAGSAPDFF